MIRHIATAGSTNDEARDPQLAHGDVVWAEEQTAGRGQRGHAWSSTPGENLTFSVVLRPTFLPAGEQFLLSEAVTLALVRTFAGYGIDTRIKWTNDIYAGDRKLVGILIEHHYAGATLDRTVAGIGINVNTEGFPPELSGTATSLLLETGRSFSRAALIGAVVQSLEQYYRKFLSVKDLSALKLSRIPI